MRQLACQPVARRKQRAAAAATTTPRAARRARRPSLSAKGFEARDALDLLLYRRPPHLGRLTPRFAPLLAAAALLLLLLIIIVIVVVRAR